jgi:hypothetical protein
MSAMLAAVVIEPNDAVALPGPPPGPGPDGPPPGRSVNSPADIGKADRRELPVLLRLFETLHEALFLLFTRDV